MMTLFEAEEVVVDDWFAVCPNADEVFMVDSEKGLKIFDVCLTYGREWDRVRVANILAYSATNKAFLITVLNKTFPNNMGIQFAARELLYRVSEDLLCSVLAFSHTGTGDFTIQFPEKVKPIPTSLLRAFGLRGSEANWFHRLAANESFVRGVAGAISDKDWDFIIHDKPTLLKSEPKEATAPRLTTKKQATLW